MREKPPKVVFVSANILSAHSADIVYIMEMCNALSKAGYSTTLCTPKQDKTKETLFAYYGVDNRFDVMEIDVPRPFVTGGLPGRASLFSLVAAWKLTRMKDLGIYVREPLIFFLITAIFRRRCIFEAHQFRFGPLRTSFYHALIKWGMKSGKGKMVCISKSLMNQWIKIGLDAGKMFVAHDAVNIDKFPGTTSKEDARRVLGLPSDLPTVVYTGSLIDGKGVDILVKCSCRLPDVRFVIVGGDDDQIQKLQQLAKNDNVIFVGQVPPDKVPLYQSAADVLALPNAVGSVIDDVTSPMKLFEYMASSRPIVASDMPSLLEILAHQHNALISPAGDDFLLSKNIQYLVEDESLSRKLVDNSLIDLDSLTWDARIKNLQMFLDFVCS